MTSVLARMNGGGNQAHVAVLSAVSQISGSSNCDSYSQAAVQERVRRNYRRARKTNSPADHSSSNFHASNDRFGRSDVSKRSAASRTSSGSANSPSSFIAQSPSKLTAYAGAKFGDAPSPRLLPLPPQHWLSNGSSSVLGPCQNLTSEIKTLLQVA